MRQVKAFYFLFILVILTWNCGNQNKNDTMISEINARIIRAGNSHIPPINNGITYPKNHPTIGKKNEITNNNSSSLNFLIKITGNMHHKYANRSANRRDSNDKKGINIKLIKAMIVVGSRFTATIKAAGLLIFRIIYTSLNFST